MTARSTGGHTAGHPGSHTRQPTATHTEEPTVTRTATRTRKPTTKVTPEATPTPTQEATPTQTESWPTDLGEPTLGARNHKPATTKTRPLSGPQLRALMKLAATEGSGLTRSDLHADPMVVVALAQKNLVTVDRTGDERAVDWIVITDAGKAAI